jgi:hypothetical protein
MLDFNEYLEKYTSYSVKNKGGDFTSVIDIEGVKIAVEQYTKDLLKLAVNKMKEDSLNDFGSNVSDCWNEESILNTINDVKF